MIGGVAKASAAVEMVVRRAERKQPVTLTNQAEHNFKDYALANLKLLVRHGLRSVEPNAFHGKVLALCGAGPSLADGPVYAADEVWGCNSAVNWLAKHGPAPTAAVGIDQSERMLDDWAVTPDVVHYVASTVDPRLTEALLARGREIRMFHNLVGWGDDEIAFYNSAPWPPSFMMATGATVLARTIGLAAWMGFRRIDVYGADCSFPNDIAHANGESVADAFGPTTMMRGVIDGREFHTRADLLMCAVDLVKLVKLHPGRIRLMGDTLPVRLMGYDDAYLDQVIRRLLPGETPPLGD